MLIYHEKQTDSLCGQHTLNNLLQGPYFTAFDLADIAHELDAKERELMMSAGADTEDALKYLAEDSGNVDGSGNFSLSVLGEALRRCHGIELEDSRSHPERLGEDRIGHEEGLVCNLLSHWFALRRMEDGAWWNLNSLLKKPEKISDFYLGAYIDSLRAEGYSIFTLKGALAAPLRDPSIGSFQDWHNIGDSSSRAPPPVPSSGPGVDDIMYDPELEEALRLSALESRDGGSVVSLPFPVSSGGGGGGEDDDLARALAMSME